MTSAWNAALDAIEVNLTATATALAAGVTPTVAPCVVVPTEPLPAGLAPRARALAELAERLRQQGAQHLERLRQRLQAVPRRTGAPAALVGHVVDFDA